MSDETISKMSPQDRKAMAEAIARVTSGLSEFIAIGRKYAPENVEPMEEFLRGFRDMEREVKG